MDAFGTDTDVRKHTYQKCVKSFGKVNSNTNVDRDERNRLQLLETGWRVMVVWECEVENDNSVLDRIVSFLGPTVFKLQ